MNPTAPRPKKIVFILSTSYAGSHFLSLLLGSHSRALHIGEIALIDRPQLDSQELYFQSGNILEGLGQKNLPQIHQTIFSRVGPDVEVLVDTSKKISWAKACLADNSCEKFFLHLIRDPRALTRRFALESTPQLTRKVRWKITRRFPSRALTAWAMPESEVWTYRWLFQNREITRFIRAHSLNATVVTYHDLATNQSAEVARLMRWLGLDFEPAQLEYWNKPHIGSQKRNYDWVKEKKTQHFDLRWKTDLTPAIQQRIADNRHVQQYLADLKVKLAENGLVREGKAYE
jgi:hypothetical protein